MAQTNQVELWQDRGPNAAVQSIYGEVFAVDGEELGKLFALCHAE
jgi:hypothetical protein